MTADSEQMRKRWAARAAAAIAVIALLVFLSGCGLFRRERPSPTPLPVTRVTEAAPATQVPATQEPTLGALNAAPSPSATRLAIQTATPPPATTGIALGVYEPAADVSGHGAAIQQYAALVGKKPAYAWFSVKWENPSTGAYQPFEPSLLDQYRTLGIMPGLNWDASKGSALDVNQPDFSWKAILSGKHDAYIQQVAASAAAYHHPYLMRVLEEMDGTWYPWGYSVNGNTNPADFVAAWKHIVDIFRNAGATNVKFAFCQSSLESGKVNSNRDKLKQLYPGDDYVDYIALDGYSNSRNKWRSLKDEFQPSYDLLTSVSNRPMIFYEVGAAENPNDPMFKANWITDGFLKAIPQQFQRVTAVSWFDGHDDENVDNYSLNTSQNSLNAWKQVVASPVYQGSFQQ